LVTMPWLEPFSPSVSISLLTVVFIPWRTNSHPQVRYVTNSLGLALSCGPTCYETKFWAERGRPPGYLSDHDFSAQFWKDREMSESLSKWKQDAFHPEGNYIVNGNEVDTVTQQKRLWLDEEYFSYLDKYFATVTWVKTNFL
jgi:hypothetical protein